MAEQPEDLEAKLHEVEEAIAVLKKTLDGPALQGALTQLLEKRERYEALLEGSGAAAQGEGATAATDHSVAVGGDVSGDITINELPLAVLKLFARQFGFDPDASDADALRTYFNNVIFERHSRLSFLFIEPKTGKVYTEADVESVFVPLRLTNPEAARRTAQHKRGEIFAARSEAMDEALSPATLPEILGRYDCLLLRGKPGSGKTTLLRHIALSFARGEHQEKLDWSGPVPLPLLVPLRNFGAFLQRKNREGDYLGPQPRALLEYLEEHLRGADVRFSADFLPRRLENGQCFLLLDALDEVSGELGNGGDLRAAVARQAAAFIRRYRRYGNRFVLTSRPRAYQDESTMRRALPQPQVCDVLDLDRAGYRQLITNLLMVLTGNVEAGQAEAADLVKRVSRNPQLADLAGNPLLCTTLVLVYKYYGRRLPERRVDVLDEVVTLLLGRWEEERHYVFSPDELVRLGTTARTTERAIEFRRRALVTLAWRMQQDAQAETSSAAAAEVLAQFYCEEERTNEREARRWAEVFLDVAHERSGLFIAIDEGLHTFAHQAFREYFAATHLVNAGEPRLQEEVLRHAPEPDEWWRQVLLLAGAHPQLSNGAAGRLIEKLMEDDDLDYVALAARFAQDMTDKLPGPQRKRLQDWLLGAMRGSSRPARERARAGQALARAGDPRRGVGLREDGLPDIVWCEVPAGLFLMGSTDEDGMAYSDEKPQHEYEIEQPYAISRYPVTNAQYVAFVQAGGYAERRYWTAAGWAWRESEGVTGPEEYGTPYNLPNHPMVGVSWYETIAFCRWLEEQLQVAAASLIAGCKLQVRDRDGGLREINLEPGMFRVQLPTEPQWEKAARSSDGRIYPWGAEPDPEKTNYDDTGIGTTSAVGCFPGGASPYGVEDLSGNVWEWCRTKLESDYRSYENDSTLEGTARRVVRGGAFRNSSRVVRCAFRFVGHPHLRYDYNGFRVVVSRA
jgi:formylglycine-generating enzyme required for sulfatase activity